ncbi:MAG: EAL domain-containing protein [Desulfuromonadaceae bacterium]|nr:EAL domain-containing protein [Desulfuromonadaceae bacterium]
MFRFHRFQYRIIFFFSGLLILVQLLAFLAINETNIRNSKEQIENGLVVGSRVFTRLMNSRLERLAESARLLSGDFAFKTAYSTGDKATILSAMDNQRSRVGADVMMIVSTDYSVMADTLRPKEAQVPFSFPELIKKAEEQGETSSIVLINGQPYQLVIVPLLAPVPISWICIGFTIDNKLARDFQGITLLDITFIRERPDHHLDILASTLSKPLSDSLISVFSQFVASAQKIDVIRLKNDNYMSIRIPLNKGSDHFVSVLMQSSVEKALEHFYRLRSALIGLFAGSIFLSLFGAVMIARSVTKPVLALAEAAKRIEEGEYEHRVTVAQKDELGSLAAAFNTMAHGIAEREEQIRYQAYHDRLTGLPNRECLHIELDKAIQSSQSADIAPILLMLNLNRFKAINGILGLRIGDLLLKQVGERLSSFVTESSITFHLGGDNFVLLFPEGRGVEHGVDIAQRLLAGFEGPFLVEGHPISLDARIGIAVSPIHGNDTETLIKCVDIAAHLAKDSADDYTVYSPRLDKQAPRQLTMLGELRQAIEQDDLVLYYQPKINIKDGRISGVESLVRWNHPEHGLVPPDDFIPLAEQTGLIKPLTRWALKTAFAQKEAFRKSGLEIKVAVNLSARNLQDEQLPLVVSELLQYYKIDPPSIILEITESAIMLDPERSMQIIKRLDGLGVNISIDDFGTGYSSLGYLQRLPVDELKIDKSFVTQMDRNSNDVVIVRSVIELAHNLGLKVTAEGIETKETYDMLEQLGCDRGQGYLMSRPLPIAAFYQWLQDSKWGISL